MAAHIERALGTYGWVWDPRAEAYTFTEVDDKTKTKRIEVVRVVGLTLTTYGVDMDTLLAGMLHEAKKALDRAIPEEGGV